MQVQYTVDVMCASRAALLTQTWLCRNKGHSRWTGFADHHFLHYLATSAVCIHFYSLMQDYYQIHASRKL